MVLYFLAQIIPASAMGTLSVDPCPFIVCACVFSFTLSSSLYLSGTLIYLLGLQAALGLSCIFCPSPRISHFWFLLLGDSTVSKLEASEGQGGLACCSPWGCKELDTTMRLNNNNN